MINKKIIVRAKKLCGSSLASHTFTNMLYCTSAFQTEVTALLAGFKNCKQVIIKM